MIYSLIQERLQTQDSKALSKALGYNNQKIFDATLAKFLESHALYEWTKSGNYDLVNHSLEFFTKLCNALEIDKDVIDDALENECAYREEVERFKSGYIFVNTNFKRRGEPIMALAALENKRYLKLYEDKELLFKSKEQLLEILSQRIKKHYEANKEGLMIWGQIVNYHLHLEENHYIFDTDGVLVEFVENPDIKLSNLSFIITP